jgi:hypothetical protein
MPAMQIDCDTCPVRGSQCADCVVSVLLGPPELLEQEQQAVALLADRGLIPPLRDPRVEQQRVRLRSA